MFKRFSFKKEKTVVTPLNKIMFSPVHLPQLTSTLYKVGEFLPHARMKVMFENEVIVYGIYFKGDESRYFVTTDLEVIAYVKKMGMIPLVNTHALQLFSDKKRLQKFVQNCSVTA